MKIAESRGNVFKDIGFDGAEAEELAVKADLVALLMRAIRQRNLTQLQASRVCGVDQPTLSKALNGKLGSVTIDRLAKWAVLLGCRVEINVRQPMARRGAYKGAIRVVRAA